MLEKNFLKALTITKKCGIIFKRYYAVNIEVWLSLVERHVRDVEAVGSNPVTSTTSEQSSLCSDAFNFLRKKSRQPASVLRSRLFRGIFDKI